MPFSGVPHFLQKLSVILFFVPHLKQYIYLSDIISSRISAVKDEANVFHSSQLANIVNKEYIN